MEIKITLTARVELSGDEWLVMSVDDGVLMRAPRRAELGDTFVSNLLNETGLRLQEWSFIETP